MPTNNKQLGINMIASMVSIIISYAITFFLTPYVVKELGVAAYGFVSLSTQIIGYSQLITIALNSMAGRFITIEYHKGNFQEANKYYNSVLGGNCFIGIFLLLVSVVLVVYLQYILNVPSELIVDVKLLFAFLSFNSILSLFTNVLAISTFIKNRLDYTNIRDVVGNILRAIVLVILFSILQPKVWFFGVTSLITTLYVSIANYRFSISLTPELRINKSFFDFSKIKELIVSGVWNLITKLSTILENGLNLLIANLFLGAELAGTYALSCTVPTMIQSICSKLAYNFAPSWTKLYASKDMDNLLNEIMKSIRIMGFLSSIPISIFAVLGYDFYSLWVPSQNASLLFWLSIAGSFVMVVAMPLESLWNIFTITNKVKKTSINLLEWSFAMFACVILGMYLSDNPIVRLFILATVKSLLASIRTLTFLPLYGAKCLGFEKKTFYSPIIKNIICVAVIIIISIAICHIFSNLSWAILLLEVCIVGVVGLLSNWFISLNESDRLFLISTIRKQLCHNP